MKTNNVAVKRVITTEHTALTHEQLQAYKKLFAPALKAREAAYAPYSNFAVGAALLSDTKKIFCGANVENASYGLTCCAERAAIFAAVAAGMRRIKALLVLADTSAPVSICGACRQVIAEFADEHSIILCTTIHGLTGAQIRTASVAAWGISDLLPDFFSGTVL